MTPDMLVPAEMSTTAPAAVRAASARPESKGQPVIGVGTLNISDRAKQLVMEALNANRLSYGPMTERFEAAFAREHGCRFGIVSNSGTSALQVALQALKELHGWQDGDEVIVPAVTFVATVNVVLHNRLQPVLVDVDPTYYELDPAQLEARITPRTRAIIPVHLFGHPADMGPIRDIARRHDLKIIEDSCETMFAGYRGARVGSWGDIGCFSMYVAHLLVTGVGGISVTNNPDYAVRMRSLVNHGRDSIYLSIDDDNGKTGEALRMIVAKRFQFTAVGHSFRITEMEAALGVAQLEEWQPMIAARRANARLLLQKLAPVEHQVQLPSVRQGSEHSFMMFPVMLREEPKAELVHFLESHGVETRDMLPLTNQPVYQRLLGWREAEFPVAQRINTHGFYIGCHQDLTDTELDYMAELFQRYFRRKPAQVRHSACLILSTGNNRAEVEAVLESLPRELFEQVIAVDDSSTDGTAELLRRHDIAVVPLEGADALTMAARGRLAGAQDTLVFFNADGRHNPRDIGRLLLTLERGHDMVVASRFLPGGARHDRGQRIRLRSIGNRIFTLLANLLFFGNASDALSGFRAVRRSCLEAASPTRSGLAGWYQVSVRAMRQGWRMAEVPTVELIKPDLRDRRRAWWSVWPLARVLVGEWRSARRAPREAV